MKRPISLRVLILGGFTSVSLVVLLIIGLTFSNLFSYFSTDMLTQSADTISQQEVNQLESYLSNARHISNVLYYDVIKQDDQTLQQKLDLLYAAYSSEIVSISLYNDQGQLVNVAPQHQPKQGVDVRQQSWFTQALSQPENVHFSSPHIQNLYQSVDYQYEWVISLSVALDLHGQRTVMVIDMKHKMIENLFEKSVATNFYSYLMTGSGQLIYHPNQNQLRASVQKENIAQALGEQDGIHQEGGRILLIKTIAYTGWKLVTVIPEKSLIIGQNTAQSLIVMIISLIMAALLLIYRAITNRFLGPLTRLNDAIGHMEGVNNLPPQLYEHGSKEVQELGATLHAYISQIHRLMDSTLKEEREKRKSELDALQAQINPHFLYNTLDSIVWMIEGEHYEQATYMITQLAAFFRLSLNRGKSMMSLENEMKQAEAYLNIQQIRYQQAFQAKFNIDAEAKKALIVKLVVQPILENAIYHGIKEAEQDGLIMISAYKEDDLLKITIQDNGYGMDLSKPLTGVGIANVDKRLKLRFGEKYGLHIESELDEGTLVTITLPYIEASLENLAFLEENTYDQMAHN